MAKLKEKRVMVAVSESTKNKVAKKLAGTGFTIGWFFDESAKEMLKPYNGKSSIIINQVKK
jgi:hypothetical protein